MREFFERHRVTIVSFAALMGPLFLLYVHGRAHRRTTVVEYALMRMTGPVQAAASHMLAGLGSMWTGYVDLVDVGQHVQAMKKEVRVLTAEALRAKGLDIENRRLRRLLDFKRARTRLVTVAAHVIGQDVSPYARVVRVAIDVGKQDGVREDMPVVTAEGLVGRVKQVAGRYAEVMLTVDARSSVNVKVAGKGVTGSVQGTGASDVYSARLLYLHKAKPLAIGDTLVTSGHDKVFPAGIEVGYIRSLVERQRGVYYALRVAPAVNFSTLEDVLVVTGTRRVPDGAGALDGAKPGARRAAHARGLSKTWIAGHRGGGRGGSSRRGRSLKRHDIKRHLGGSGGSRRSRRSRSAVRARGRFLRQAPGGGHP